MKVLYMCVNITIGILGCHPYKIYSRWEHSFLFRNTFNQQLISIRI